MNAERKTTVTTHRCAAVVMGLLVCVLSVAAVAAELEPRTLQAYEAYVASVRQAFLGDGPSPAGDDQPGHITRVPGGLVHHWRGATFIPGVALDDVLAVAQDYDRYAAIHTPVLESRLLAREGNTFRVFARMKEGGGMVTAVLDVWSEVTYVRGAGEVRALGEARVIRQLEDGDWRRPRYLPPGENSGYLWAANTFTRFTERDGGVRVELDTLGLSRRFPKFLGWIVEPIVKRIGRSSAERTLAEFSAAVSQGRLTDK